MLMIIDYAMSKLSKILPIASKILLGVTVVVILAVMVMTTLPAKGSVSADSGTERFIREVNKVVVHPVSVVQQDSPEPVEPADSEFEPLINGMGGTCISGTVIDVYHQSGGAGWVVTVTPPQGNPISHTTGPDGVYVFTGLGAGVHKVEIASREGWRPFTPASFEVVLSGLEKDGCAITRGKMEALPCLKVTKTDQDGQMGLNNPVALADWAITVSSGSAKETKRTDSNGIVEFRYLTPGIWSVEEETKLGWIPADGQISSVELTSPHQPYTCQQVVLVNQQLHTSCIAVRKLDDRGNPLAAWQMRLDRKDGTRKSEEALTNNEGYAFFTDLELGEWVVTETLQSGYRPVTPVSQAMNLEQPAVLCPLLTFVNEPTCGVRGYKINHFDQGLNDWPIIATFSDGTSIMTKTDATGFFSFMNLKCGEWTFKEDLHYVDPAHPDAIPDPRIALEWEPVTPSELTFTLVPGVIQEMRFKNRAAKACIDVYKYDNVGIPLADWEMTVTARYNNQFVAKGTTLGNGVVEFIVNPGEYTVTETMKPMWQPVGPTQQSITVEATGYCGSVIFENMQTPPYGPDDPASDVTSQVVNQDPDQTTANAEQTPPSCRTTYTVNRGDSLYSISQTFGVGVAELREANHIDGNIIFPGNVFCIP